MARHVPALLAAALLAGCDADVDLATAGDGPIRYEAACALPGLAVPQRQTVIVLDQASLALAEEPEAFRARNPDLVPTVIAVADATTAVANGALAPRERVSLYVAPGTEGRDFAAALFLGSGANLASWSSRAPAALPPAPVTVRDYLGEVQYGTVSYPIQLRLASDSGGRLVNSWILVRGERPTGTPLTGSISCAGERCRVVGDDGGFAQAWSPAPGGQPEYDPNMPFGGLRNVEITIDGAQGQGRIFDHNVADVAGRPDIRFSFRRSGGGGE
jgi:hypothetical protein